MNAAASGERSKARAGPCSLDPKSVQRTRPLSSCVRERASAEMTRMYRSSTAEEAHNRATALCVDYLVVGPPERGAYPKLAGLLDASPHLFAPAFRNDSVAIYAVSGSWNREGCPH